MTTCGERAAGAGAGAGAPPAGYTPRPALRPSQPASTRDRWASEGANRGSYPNADHTERVTASFTSCPMRSIRANGPMRKPQAPVSTASMCCGAAACSSYTRHASA